MLRAILAGALAVLAAAPAAANTLAYTCQGYAEDASGGRLAAFLSVGADGHPGEMTSTWMPPGKASALVKGAAVYDAELAITGAGEALVTVAALAPPGARTTPSALYRELDSLRLTVSIDGAGPRSVGYTDDVIAEDLPLTASRTARLSLSAGTRTVDVTLRDAKGAEVRSARFDLSNEPARQRLFDSAAATARSAAADYKTCEKTG